MNLRLQTIKALSILLLLSVSASSYSMQHLRRAWNNISTPVVTGVAVTAGLGALAYQIYKVNYSEPVAEQSGQMIVVNSTVTDLPIAAPSYVVPVEGEKPIENMVVPVTGIESGEGTSKARAPKKLTWADDQGEGLSKVHKVANLKSALVKYEQANDKKVKNRPSNAVALYKSTLAQSKRTPSRKARVQTQVAPASITIQRNEAVLTNAQAQIKQFNRLAQEAQAARAAQEERKKKDAAEKKEKRQAVNFHRTAKR